MSEIEKLQAQIHEGAEETKTYLASLKEKLGEYDAHYKVSETATSFLQAGMDRAQASVDELKSLGERLKNSSKDTSGAVVEATRASLTKVNSSLADLKTRGREYDEKFKDSLSSKVHSAKDGVVSASSAVSSSIEHIVSATKAKTASGFEQLTEKLASVQTSIGEYASSAGHSAAVVTGEALLKAEEVDSKYGVTYTISGAVAAVTAKVGEIDESLGVSKTAASLDEKVTGGMGASLVNKGLDLVHSSVEYVSETLQQVKASATEADQRSAAEAAAPTEKQPAEDAAAAADAAKAS